MADPKPQTQMFCGDNGKSSVLTKVVRRGWDGGCSKVILFKLFLRFPSKILKFLYQFKIIKKNLFWFFLPHCAFISKKISNKSSKRMNLNFYNLMLTIKVWLVFTAKGIF